MFTQIIANVCARVELAAGASYVKGNRVLVNLDDNTWYLGTVTRVPVGHINVTFDNGTKDSFKVPTKWIKLVDLTKTVKKAYTDQQVKDLTDKKAAPKPAATKPATTTKPIGTKPSVPVKKEVVKLVDNWETNECNKSFADISPRNISREAYDVSPYLGIPFHTGRSGPTGEAVVIGLGLSPKDRKQNFILRTPHKEDRMRFLYIKTYGYKSQDFTDHIMQLIGKKLSLKKVPYETFIGYREDFKEVSRDAGARREDRSKQAEENVKKFNISWQDEGKKKVLIKWDRGYPSWHVIRGIKYDQRGQLVGIKGGGQALRWFPMNYVIGLEDAKEYDR